MKYDGDEVEIRIATVLGSLTTAPPLTNVDSIKFDIDPSIKEVPTGVGDRTTEVYEHLQVCAGTLVRWFDEALGVVSGDVGNFAHAVGGYTSTALTPLYVKIINKTTTKFVILNNCIGKYSRALASPDGFLLETWDFKFNTITGEA